MKDLITFWFLQLKSQIRYFFDEFYLGTEFKLPKNYVVNHIDNFVNLNNWDTDYGWGNLYHPDNYYQWFDKEQIKISPRGVELNAVVKPREFKEIQTTIPNAVGTLVSKKSWKYGIFIIKAKFPEGKWLWPAAWLTGFKSWPPEIDIAEGWSKNTIDYNNSKEISSNIIYGEGSNVRMTGSKDHKLPNDVTNEYIDYILHWEEGFIKIYYNGYLVFKLTDKKILARMFEPMRIVLNAGVDDKGRFVNDNRLPFVIKQVQVYTKIK